MSFRSILFTLGLLVFIVQPVAQGQWRGDKRLDGPGQSAYAGGRG